MSSHTYDRLEFETGGRPVQIDGRAFHGPLGEIVSEIAPESEADPVAILVDLLAAFGNAAGRGPHFMVGGSYHSPAVFPVLVGPTARARKGTSHGYIQQVMEHADPDWAADHVATGLASGEGLIARLRGEGEAESDRRLFVYEPEFAKLLVAANRDGSTLSPILRSAWDGDRLASLTRGNPITVTDYLVSMIGHITEHELAARLNRVDLSNGFANRFLWFCVQRSQRLPSGGSIGPDDFVRFGRIVRTALDRAQRIGEMRRSEAATELWEVFYCATDDKVPGVVGAQLARLEAQLLRLSMIYALAEGSEVVEPAHICAGAAVLDYASASTNYLLGSETGDRTMDRVVRVLRTREPLTVSRTDLHRELGGHTKSKELDQILSDLEARGLIERERLPTGGRSREEIRYIGSGTVSNMVPGMLGGKGVLATLDAYRRPNPEPGEESEENEENPYAIAEANLRLQGISFEEVR